MYLSLHCHNQNDSYIGKREFIYLSLNCHHQNDSSIKMGSDVSHFTFEEWLVLWFSTC